MLNFRVYENSIRTPPWLPLLLLLGLSGCSNIPLWNFGKSPAQVKQDSIARLSYSNANGKEEFGTGFFVQAPSGTCALLTVSHLVAASRVTKPIIDPNQPFNLVKSINLRIQTPDARNWKASNVQILPELDLAIVAFDPSEKTCPYTAVKFGKSDKVKVTDQIYIVGYKAGTEKPESYIVSGVLTAVLDVPREQGYKFSHDAGLLSGMTGGPILNQRGQVIGINGLNETEISKLQNLSIQSVSEKNSSRAQDSTAQPETTQALNLTSEIRWAIPSKEYQENIPEISLTPAPPTAKEWASWGTVLYHFDDNSNALTAFEKAIELDPNDAYSWRQKAFIVTSLHKYEEGLIAAEKAIELDSDSPYAFGAHALALLGLERYEEAIPSLRKSVEINTEYILGWGLLGDVLIKLKQHAEAIKSLDRALALDSKNVYAWQLKGSALFALNKYDEALSATNRSLEIDPQSFPSLFLKGGILSALQRWDECLSSINQALTIKNENATAWEIKSLCLNNLERYNEAIESAEKAINLDENSAWAWKEKARALALIGRDTQAFLAIDKALSIDDKPVDYWVLKGLILAKMGQHQEAIEMLDRALEIDPKSKEAQEAKDLLQ